MTAAPGTVRRGPHLPRIRIWYVAAGLAIGVAFALGRIFLLASGEPPAAPPLISGNPDANEFARRLGARFAGVDEAALDQALGDEGFRRCPGSGTASRAAYFVWVRDAPGMPLHTFGAAWKVDAAGRVSDLSGRLSTQVNVGATYDGWFNRGIRLMRTGRRAWGTAGPCA